MGKGTAWRKVAGGILAAGWIALLAATLMAGLAGCGANSDGSADGGQPAAVTADADEEADTQSIPEAVAEQAAEETEQANENATREGGVVFAGDTVVLTLDAETLAALGGGVEDFTGAGFESVEATADGGVALTMTAANYNEMIAEMREGFLAELDAIAADETSYPSIASIEADEDFARFTITVRRESYEDGAESLVEMLLGMYSVVWQVYTGAELRAPAISLVDAASGEVYESFTVA